MKKYKAIIILFILFAAIACFFAAFEKKGKQQQMQSISSTKAQSVSQNSISDNNTNEILSTAIAYLYKHSNISSKINVSASFPLDATDIDSSASAGSSFTANMLSVIDAYKSIDNRSGNTIIYMDRSDTFFSNGGTGDTTTEKIYANINDTTGTIYNQKEDSAEWTKHLAVSGEISGLKAVFDSDIDGLVNNFVQKDDKIYNNISCYDYSAEVTGKDIKPFIMGLDSTDYSDYIGTVDMYVSKDKKELVGYECSYTENDDSSCSLSIVYSTDSENVSIPEDVLNAKNSSN